MKRVLRDLLIPPFQGLNDRRRLRVILKYTDDVVIKRLMIEGRVESVPPIKRAKCNASLRNKFFT